MIGATIEKAVWLSPAELRAVADVLDPPKPSQEAIEAAIKYIIAKIREVTQKEDAE